MRGIKMTNELRKHIIKLMKSGIRLDGRKADELRKPIKVECGVVNTADGSARVILGETEVIAGVKLEVGTPYPDKPGEGSIIVGAELLPMSSPDFESGPPSIQGIELARVVDRGIRECKAIDFKKLCITEGEKVWIIVIDVCVINDAGNLFDVAALAALSALKDTRYPKFDGEKIEHMEHTDEPLPLTENPLAVTVLKIGDELYVDPSSEEEKVVDARLTVASIEDGNLCALQKGGDEPLSADDIDKMIKLGMAKTEELRKLL
mgnify:CR=1 FL=1|tara:strand:- start:18441 stop:19229 length:789 start_codon:yes stop_codon:yes gene_type:complete